MGKMVLLAMAANGPQCASAAHAEDVVLPTVTVERSASDGQTDDDRNPGLTRSSTSTKTDTTLQETPAAVQVITKQTLEDQSAGRLQDALTNVSGVQSIYAFGGGYERYVVRGFEQSVANYRNGQLIPLSRFDFADVDRVEVLKGPEGALYGAGDPGGIVNIVTKRPSENASYTFSQSAGSYDSYRSEVGATGPMTENGPLRYRIDAAYDVGHTFRQLSDNRRAFIAPTLEWNVSPQTLVRLSYEHQDDRYVYDSGIPASGTGLASYSRSLTFGSPGLHDQQQNDLGNLTFEHQFGGSLKLSGGLLAFRNHKDYEDVYLWGDDRYGWFGGENVTTQSSWLDLQGKTHLAGFDHEWLVGTSYRAVHSHTESTDDYIDSITPATFNPDSSSVDVASLLNAEKGVQWDQKSHDAGLSLQDQIVLASQWRLLTGLRLDKLTRDLSYAYYSDTTLYHRNDTGASPRVALSYLPAQNWTFYTSYGTSFGPGVEYQNDSLSKPEKARQFEVGAKWQTPDGRFAGTTALYHLVKSNIAEPDPDNANISTIVREARSRGLEMDLKGYLTKQWSVLANYSYTDAVITRSDSGDYTGNRLPYAARHQGSLWTRYELEDAPGVTLGAGVFGATRRYGDIANSYSDGSYARLDMMAAWRLPVEGSDTTLQLNVYNVTDTLYYNLRTRWSNMPSAPRTILATLKVGI